MRFIYETSISWDILFRRKTFIAIDRFLTVTGLQCIRMMRTLPEFKDWFLGRKTQWNPETPTPLLKIF